MSYIDSDGRYRDDEYTRPDNITLDFNNPEHRVALWVLTNELQDKEQRRNITKRLSHWGGD